MQQDIIFVSDFFANELNGGAELCNEAIIEILSEHFNVTKEHTKDFSTDHINKETQYIFSNFAKFTKEQFDSITEQLIQNDVDYSVILHDHLYCIYRDPSKHGKDLTCNCFDKNSTVHMFLFFAKNVFCQTEFHTKVVEQNTYCNTINLGSNLWTQDELNWLDDCKKNDISSGKYIIFDSPFPHKNTKGTVEYANKNGYQFELVSGLTWKDYVKKLSKSEGIIFLPRLAESASRLVFEAKYLGKKVVTNKLVGYVWEKWWSDKEYQPIEAIKRASTILINSVSKKRPQISIFCTTFNSEKFINGFLDSTLNQSFADDYELIIYDGKSTDSTYNKLLENKNNKLKVFQTNNKVGVYAGWNRALSKCSAPIVVNMNVDDRFSPNALDKLYNEIKKDFDLIYANSYVTYNPNETFENATKSGELRWPEYDRITIKRNCYFGHFPMWRKNLLLKAGLFNEKFKSVSDWQQWIKFSMNDANCKHLDEFLGLYYFNPNGVSTNGHGASQINAIESQEIARKYE